MEGTEGTVVSRSWRCQAFDREMKEWYFIGGSSHSLESARRHRDGYLKPAHKRLKFRIIETAVTERVVE